MRSAIGLVVAALALTLAFGPGAASAGKKRAVVNVTLEVTSDNDQPAPDFFEGKVKSKRPSCKREGRKVVLVQYGNVVATGTVDSNRGFEFQVGNPHSSVFPYKAKLTRTKRCRAGTSIGVFAQ